MNKIVVLAGAGGHLGPAMLASLLSDFDVIGISRHASSVLTRIPREYINKYYPLDLDFALESTGFVVEAIDKVLSSIDGDLVGVVNNAFFSYPSSSLAIDKEAVAESSDGLFGYWIRLSLTIASRMTKPASIVNISSMYARVSPRPSVYDSETDINPIVYGAMKAALVQASKYLSSLLAPKGVRVNSVSFGPFPSRHVQETDPEFIARLASHTHLNRIGAPAEAGAVVKFLISSESSYITGADIPVDGGWTAW